MIEQCSDVVGTLKHLFCRIHMTVLLICFFFAFSAQWAMASLMVISYMVELCVTAVIIVNYCAQCELLIFYLREINLQMEEKTKDLAIIMKVLNNIH